MSPNAVWKRANLKILAAIVNVPCRPAATPCFVSTYFNSIFYMRGRGEGAPPFMSKLCQRCLSQIKSRCCKIVTFNDLTIDPDDEAAAAGLNGRGKSLRLRGASGDVHGNSSVTLCYGLGWGIR